MELKVSKSKKLLIAFAILRLSNFSTKVYTQLKSLTFRHWTTLKSSKVTGKACLIYILPLLEHSSPGILTVFNCSIKTMIFCLDTHNTVRKYSSIFKLIAWLINCYLRIRSHHRTLQLLLHLKTWVRISLRSSVESCLLV
jgi:hypothetical protein